MATLQEIRDAIDARLQTRWATIVNRQNAFAASHGGRYFQGLLTHGTPPSDGNSVAADKLGSRPTDQAESWTVFGIGAWAESFAIQIDTYDGPSGKGWVATAYVVVAGKTYSRSRGVGPEHRDVAWHEVLDGPN